MVRRAGSCHNHLEITWDVLALAEGYNTLWRRWEEALRPREWVWGKTQELAGKGVQLALRGCPRARAGGHPCINTRVRGQLQGNDSQHPCRAHAGT